MAGSAHGGAEMACIDMVLAMAESGVETALVSRPHTGRQDELSAAGAAFYTAPFGRAVDFYTPCRLKKIIRKFKPDIIQSWMSRGASFVPRWSPALGVPAYKHVGRLGSPYKAKYFKTCDGIVGITPELTAHGRGFGCAAVQVNNFAEMMPMQGGFKRADYNTPENAIILLGLGRLHDDKAFDVLIKAVAALPAHYYAWIAGEGPDRAQLMQLAEDLGVAQRVVFLGWQNDRAALFDAADLCVFISRDEGFGTVFVQSWLAGVPVIVSDADGPRQFVRDGEDGLIVPREDVAATVQAIERLAGDKALQKRFVKAGRARYEAEFTKQASVDGYLDFYQSLSK